MEDTKIIELFNMRSEEALKQTEKKYGALCCKVASDILHNSEDACECKNDALLAAWNQIPPDVPQKFRAYLCRIVRNISLNRLRSSQAAKRNVSKNIPIEELAVELRAVDNIIQEVENKELTRAIEHFLDTISKEKRVMFVKRYWFGESVKSIASQFGIGQRQASVKLGRIRKELLKYLEQEEWV